MRSEITNLVKKEKRKTSKRTEIKSIRRSEKGNNYQDKLFCLALMHIYLDKKNRYFFNSDEIPTSATNFDISGDLTVNFDKSTNFYEAKLKIKNKAILEKWVKHYSEKRKQFQIPLDFKTYIIYSEYEKNFSDETSNVDIVAKNFIISNKEHSLFKEIEIDDFYEKNFDFYNKYSIVAKKFFENENIKDEYWTAIKKFEECFLIDKTKINLVTQYNEKLIEKINKKLYDYISNKIMPEINSAETKDTKDIHDAIISLHVIDKEEFEYMYKKLLSPYMNATLIEETKIEVEKILNNEQNNNI